MKLETLVSLCDSCSGRSRRTKVDGVITLTILSEHFCLPRTLMSAPASAPVSGSNRSGKIRAELHADHVAFPEMMYTYPLKLLAPRLSGTRRAAIVYMLSYGGGLLGGDRVRLDIDVGSGVKLLLLSQVRVLPRGSLVVISYGMTL